MGDMDGAVSAFLDSVCVLRSLNFDALCCMDEVAKLSFWVNLYHLLLLHGIMASGLPSSRLAVFRFHQNTSYNVAGIPFSLIEIEHGILRRPLSPPRMNIPKLFHSFIFPKNLSDAKFACALQKPERRIGFVLCAGSLFSNKRIPILADGHSPERVEEQFATCSSLFLADYIDIVSSSPSAATIQFPRTCEWYLQDFQDNHTCSVSSERSAYIIIAEMLNHGPLRTKVLDVLHSTSTSLDIRLWDTKSSWLFHTRMSHLKC